MTLAFRWFALAAAGSAGLAAGLSEARAADAAPKTHSLYLGAEISVLYHNKLCPVVDVQGDALVINTGDRRVPVPLAKDPVAVKIVDTLKLGPIGVAVDKLNAEPTYTPANDPRRKFARNVGAAAAAGSEMNRATAGMAAAQSALAYAQALPASSYGREALIANGEQSMNEAGRAMDAAQAQSNSDFNNAGYYANKLEQELDKKLFDAMEITFQISSTRPLVHPYVIAVTQLHDRDAKPGEYRNWLVAKRLDPVDTTPQKIRIFQSGLPVGYSVESFRLHVYDGAAELPTTASSKRVPLSLNEAFQYVMLEHLSAHPHDTVSASVGVVDPPSDLLARVAAGEFPRTYYARIGRDGVASGVFLDADCKAVNTDNYVNSIVKAARFKPALEKGKPIESVLPIKLGQLAN